MIQIGAVEYECACETTRLSSIAVDDLSHSLLLLVDVQAMDTTSAEHLHHLVVHGRARVVTHHDDPDAPSELATKIASADVVSRLTARELEVAGLAAWGLTNPQIAARLGTSARTVGNQLQRVYTKLDIHDRALLREYFAGANTPHPHLYSVT